jgi:glycosyltransferase involved in cell wall biosynthesis
MYESACRFCILAEIMRLSYLHNKKILLISPESFDHIPVSKHHYASVLAEAGNRVFFLNPPGTINSIKEDSGTSNLMVVDYRTVRGTNSLPAFLRNAVNRFLIRRIQRICNSTFDVVWNFDPFRFQNLKLFSNSERTIYHVVDAHVAPLELEAAESADVIFSTADEILRRFHGIHKPMWKINHGLAAHFLAMKPKAFSKGNVLVVGYVGNLNSNALDQSLLENIVASHTFIDFLFVGPYQSHSGLYQSLQKHRNCSFVGKVPSNDLPRYLSRCDLFLTTYRENQPSVNANRHKTLEFLATGKPVVMTYTDEYRDSELVFMAKKNADLPALFDQVIAEYDKYSTNSIAERRINYARSNAYTDHVRTIDGILANFRDDRISRSE